MVRRRRFDTPMKGESYFTLTFSALLLLLHGWLKYHEYIVDHFTTHLQA